MLRFIFLAAGIIAVFRLLFNVALVPVTIGGNLLIGQSGGDIVGRFWKWFGTIVIASLLAALAWSTGASAGRVILYLATGAMLMWHLVYVGGHMIRKEGFKRGDWGGVDAGDLDIRYSWIAAVAVPVFGLIPILAGNPLTVNLLQLFNWGLSKGVLRFIIGLVGSVWIIHVIITTGSMLWTFFLAITARRHGHADV